MPIALPMLVPSPNAPVTALTRVKLTQALSENFVTFFGKLNLLDEFNQPFTGGARGTNGYMNASSVERFPTAHTGPGSRSSRISSRCSA